MLVPVVPIQMSPETERWRAVHGGGVVPAHKAGSDALPEPSPETCKRGPCWETLIGRIVSFTPDPDSIIGCLPTEKHVRYCGSVLRVEPAPDFKGFPTCLATVVGRSGKQLTINYTQCYAQTHDSWAEAERSK